MQKAERHKVILDLISGRAINRQDQLAGLLRDNGFEVTQASVSRDLDEIGVIKIGGRYVESGNGVEANLFGIRAIETSGDNMLVVKCASGLASAAAVRTDAEKIPEIVGTIAGDDTIFIAVKNATAQRAALKKLRALLTR